MLELDSSTVKKMDDDSHLRITFALNRIEHIFVKMTEVLDSTVPAVLADSCHYTVVHILAIAAFSTAVIECHRIKSQEAN